MAQTGLSGIERKLWEYPEQQSAKEGALLVIVCGLHGNEPAGVLAAQSVFDELMQSKPQCNGRVVALCGNLSALSSGQRYHKRDLNRIWTESELKSLRSGVERDAESHEMRELLLQLDPLMAGGWRHIALLDLHSTSASGPPSVICADTLPNRRVAKALSMPVLLGLEETLPGTLLSYFSERGHIALCVEGGQSDAPSTVDNHVASIWLCMHSLGLLSGVQPALLSRSKGVLASNAACKLNFIEVRFRQEVGDEQGFWMERGFTHCHPISENRLLAHIERGGVRVPLKSHMEGVLLMPRYQGQGNDGYFIGRQVRARWLWLSNLLRRLRLHWILSCFRGVRRDPGHASRLLVDGDRLGPVLSDLLGLFGYRMCSSQGHKLTYMRRPQ